MSGPVPAGIGDEIQQMQDGVRDWVQHTARRGKDGLRTASPVIVLSLLCASAFCPLLLATGVAGAGISVVSSVGGGFLTQVISDTLDRLRQHSKARTPSRDDLEAGIAQQIQRVLAAGDERANALRSEIASVLQEIDAAGTALRAAIETGDESVRSHVIDAIRMLNTGFAEMGFLIKDVARAAADIQKSLDAQGASVRTIIDQNARQSAEIRLAREELAVMQMRTWVGVPAGAAGDDRGPRWIRGCPYRGLQPFGEADADVFYGRERLATELAVKLARQQTRGGLVVVTGASGAGKSSLLRAGLLPTLARGVQFEGSDHWPRMFIMPTKDPLTELATHLAALGGNDTVVVRDGLAHRPGQAHLTVRQAVLADSARRSHGRPLSAENTARLVLIVDQFEQVFTLNPGPGGEAERQAFITALRAAATNPAGPNGHPPALVVIAVRGDFCDRCATYPELAHGLQEGQFVVGPMTESDLRLVITGPAHAAGLHIDPVLVDTILADLRVAFREDAAGVLPLLSQAMLLTWQNREGDRLTAHGYSQAGGVSGAVQTSAEQAFGSLPAEQQALAREILRSMTVASRDGRFTRRPVTRADLYAGHPGTDRPKVDTVLETFASERLVVLNEGIAQIAHDALLTTWPKLRGWLEDDQASWILHGQFADDAAAWHDHGDDPSFLYRGTQLAAVRQAATRWSLQPGRYPALTSTQRAFLHASEHAAARGIRQRRILAVSLILLLVASLAGAGLAAAASRNANYQRSLAVSAQLAAESEGFDTTDTVTASLLAAAAWRAAPTAQARESMLQVLAQPERAVLTSGIQDGGGRAGSEAVAFSPDGKILATAGNGVRLWDVATRRQIGPTMTDNAHIGFDRDLFAVAFSPAGKILATAGADGKARLWDVATHRQIGAPMTMAGGVDTVAFSPDGKSLATAGPGGTARLWDLATHQQVSRPVHASAAGSVVAVAFSPSGKILATGGSDGTARLWDVATRRQIGTPLTAAGSVYAVAFSPDGKILATADDGAARLWDLATHQQIGAALHASAAGSVVAVAFSPDGKTLATGGFDGTARLWDVAIYRQIGAPMTVPTGVYAVAYSPNGNMLATTGGDGKVRLWDVATRRRVGAPITHHARLAYQRQVLAVAFSPSGKVLATAGADGKVRLWDVATHHLIGLPLNVRAFGHAFPVAFSPDGKILATAGPGTARLWDLATHRQTGPPMYSSGRGSVNAVAFSPDGKTLATAGPGGTARLWDVATHRQVGPPMTASGPGFVNAVAFSSDGKTLATAGPGGTARLWNVATHRQVGLPLSPNSLKSVNAVAFSPDGKILATAGDDGNFRLWDVATHRQIGPPMTHGGDGAGEWVAFSPDGKTLATAGVHGAVRLWDVAFPSDLLNAVCSIPGRSLTYQEWKAYVPSESYRAVCP